MPRPHSPRCIAFKPGTTYFKPCGVPLASIEKIALTLDEVEALRLADLEGGKQSECAKSMEVSQATFFRILQSARHKVAQALTQGNAIELKGGTVIMPNRDGTGPVGGGFGRGRGKGFGRGGGQGAPGTCKCPQCGHEVAHTRGTPCVKLKCPKCKIPLVRGDIT
ncbi:MAG TPA: DUF134 domain-containing protein [bacterium]|nr:DUF134 domain-containing protein [bacterium]